MAVHSTFPSSRLIAFFILILTSGSSLAEPPPGHYDSVDSSNPLVLRQTLHEVIDDHIRFPLTSGNTDTWDILEEADEDPADPGRILDLYRNASYQKHGGGNPEYQREHTWPNSYGFPEESRSFPHTDSHALFLADGSYNGSRGRLPYRFCGPACEEKPTEANHGRGGPSVGYPGNSNWRTGANNSSDGAWETWSGRRGDVARAIFYMDVRYEGGFHGVTGDEEPDLVATDDLSKLAPSGVNLPADGERRAFMGRLSDLLSWHREDPVDDLERARNDAVFGFQRNRNPFIDHPEWAECLFAGQCSGTVLSLAEGRFRVTARWRTSQGTSGVGQPVPITRDTGFFWFFAPENIELVIKILDACEPFDRFWVFAGGLTNVEVEIEVEDTFSGITRHYSNPQGRPFQPIQDTGAFDTCGAAPNQAPMAAFSSQCRGLRCDFEDESSDPDGFIDSRRWEFGDGEESSFSSPSHQYVSFGDFGVRLTITDDAGASASVEEVAAVRCVREFLCCRVCTQGRACGDTCISRSRVCRQSPGCACDSADVCR